jgi:rhodanese-related sulfurtransferase
MFGSKPPAIPQIGVDQVPRLVTEGALLVDIRETDEWNQGRIGGAVLKPMSAINDWYDGLPRDRKIILYCASGQRSSQTVQALIQQADFDNVVNMTGGIKAWLKAELPIEE